MIGVAEAVKGTVVKRELTRDEKDAVADILDAAAEWRRGALPLDAFALVGKLPAWNAAGRRCESAGYGRALALMATPQSDPRWRALRAAIEALVRRQDVVVTRQGVFDRSELEEHGVTVRGDE